MCHTTVQHFKDMKQFITKEVILSAMLGGMALAFLYRATMGVDRNVLHLVLWNAGCGFGMFSIAAQPQLLFERVVGLRIKGSGRHVGASYLDFLSGFCMVLAIMTWLAA
jgi:hypothetical protein